MPATCADWSATVSCLCRDWKHESNYLALALSVFEVNKALHLQQIHSTRLFSRHSLSAVQRGTAHSVFVYALWYVALNWILIISVRISPMMIIRNSLAWLLSYSATRNTMQTNKRWMKMFTLNLFFFRLLPSSVSFKSFGRIGRFWPLKSNW